MMTSINTDDHGYRRPMLRPSVVYRSVHGGVDFRLGDHGFQLRSKIDYKIIHRLVSLCTGTTPLVEIKASLPEKVLPAFDLILNNLAKHQLLTEGPSGSIDKNVLKLPIVPYLQDLSEEWEINLVKWISCDITVCAPDCLLPTLLHSLEYTGASHIRILQTAERDDIIGDSETLLKAFNTKRVNPAEFLQNPPKSSSLLLYAHNLNDTTSNDLNRIAQLCGTVVGAVLFVNGALVGALPCATFENWIDICRTIEIAGDELTYSAQQVAMALTVLESLHSIVGTPKGTNLEEIVKLVRSDGTSSPLSISALKARRQIDTYARANAPIAALRDNVSGWREPETGLFKLAKPPGAPYPLAHCAYEIQLEPKMHGATKSIVSTWGSSMAAAESRAMLASCEQLALEMDPALRPTLIAASTDFESAEKRIRARWLAQCSDTSSLDWIRGEIAALDAEIQMLCRLAHLYWEEWPKVEIAFVAEGCWMARVQLTKFSTIAVEAEQRTAVEEAIGEALSACQIGQISDLQARLSNALCSDTIATENQKLCTCKSDLPMPPNIILVCGQLTCR